MTLKIGVTAASSAQDNAAQALAKKLQLPFQPEHADLLLTVSSERIQLQQTGTSTAGAVYADFVTGKSAHRRLFGGGRGTPMARAAGLKAGKTPSIVDATAGLGQDAFVLASLGCQVTLIEQSPIVATLLEDALARALLDEEIKPIAQRMQLVNADACDYLTQLTPKQYPEVIYLDPMYPHGNKKALAKKEMRLFQLLLGADTTGAALLEIAQTRALKRVLVKRPQKAPTLGGIKPDAVIRSPKTRFDLYFRKC